MDRYCIKITEATLDLVEFLNDGVRPELEPKKTTYFIFDVSDKSHNEIIDHAQLEEMLGDPLFDVGPLILITNY